MNNCKHKLNELEKVVNTQNLIIDLSPKIPGDFFYGDRKGGDKHWILLENHSSSLDILEL